MTETRVKTESQAFWDSDQNLDGAFKWIEDNFGFKDECFITECVKNGETKNTKELDSKR